MKNLKDLKEMMHEPSSKEFFKKHGLPKGITHHPAKHNALKKMKYPDSFTSKKEEDTGNSYKPYK